MKKIEDFICHNFIEKIVDIFEDKNNINTKIEDILEVMLTNKDAKRTRIDIFMKKIELSILTLYIMNKTHYDYDFILFGFEGNRIEGELFFNGEKELILRSIRWINC